MSGRESAIRPAALAVRSIGHLALELGKPRAKRHEVQVVIAAGSVPGPCGPPGIRPVPAGCRRGAAGPRGRVPGLDRQPRAPRESGAGSAVRSASLLSAATLDDGRISSDARAARSARTASSIRPVSRCPRQIGAGQVTAGNRSPRVFFLATLPELDRLLNLLRVVRRSRDRSPTALRPTSASSDRSRRADGRSGQSAQAPRDRRPLPRSRLPSKLRLFRIMAGLLEKRP